MRRAEASPGRDRQRYCRVAEARKVGLPKASRARPGCRSHQLRSFDNRDAKTAQAAAEIRVAFRTRALVELRRGDAGSIFIGHGKTSRLEERFLDGTAKAIESARAAIFAFGDEG